jgi:hypothetical protein
MSWNPKTYASASLLPLLMYAHAEYPSSCSMIVIYNKEEKNKFASLLTLFSSSPYKTDACLAGTARTALGASCLQWATACTRRSRTRAFSGRA